MPVTKEDGTLVLALVRGDDRLEEAKLARALGADFRPATEEEIRAAFGADPGSLGPVGFDGRDRRRRDAARGPVRRRREPHGLAPARRRARPRLRGRASPTSAQPKEGDACPSCGGALRFQTAIEVGHIFKLGTRYSVPLGATFLDEDGEEKPLVMGSYGIGPGRIIAAARRAAPRRARDRLAARARAVRRPRRRARPGRRGREAASRSRTRSRRRAATSCSTTATCGPGEKFADADLIGCPIAGHRRQEDARGRRGRRPRPRHRRRTSRAFRRRQTGQGARMMAAATEVQRGAASGRPSSA